MLKVHYRQMLKLYEKAQLDVTISGKTAQVETSSGALKSVAGELADGRVTSSKPLPGHYGG
jgi:hypothetical protein